MSTPTPDGAVTGQVYDLANEPRSSRCQGGLERCDQPIAGTWEHPNGYVFSFCAEHLDDAPSEAR